MADAEPKPKPSKYRAVPVVVDGIRFASKAEAARWLDLCAQTRDGAIFDLQRQVKFRLDVNGTHICDYLCDFTYRDKHGYLTVEDCKGALTPTYRLKKKLMRAVLGIAILETGRRPPRKRKRKLT